MQTQDYYAVLEIPPDADDKTIKKAYRKLARQYHPDINSDNQQAEERFKAVNEAYQTLSDPEKRRRYDEMRQQSRYWQHFGAGEPADWGQWQDVAGGRVYSQTISPEEWRDIFSGQGDIFSDMFGSAFGGGFQGNGAPRAQRGRDIDATVHISLEEALHGARRTLEVGERRIEARIPPGVYDGARVRLAGQGAPGYGDGAPGDLYLVIQMQPDERFTRHDADLTTEAEVDIFTAATGGEARVRTLDGTVMLKIPPQTQAGTRFRLKGKGMPRLGQADQRGDLYVSVKLVLPPALSEEELATLREMAAARKAAPVA